MCTGVALSSHTVILTHFLLVLVRSAAEFLGFFAKTVAERTPTGSRQSIEEDNVTFHAHCRADGLVGLVACDAEYPWRVAFSLIGKVCTSPSSSNMCITRCSLHLALAIDIVPVLPLLGACSCSARCLFLAKEHHHGPNQMMDEFSSKYPNPDMWTGNEKDTPYVALKDLLQRYQVMLAPPAIASLSLLEHYLAHGALRVGHGSVHRI